MTFGRRGQAASLAAAKPLQTISGKPVVYDISRRGRNQAEDCSQRKWEPQQRKHTEHCCGPHSNQAVFYQDNRPHSGFRQPGMPQELSAGFSLTGRETEDIAAIESQQKIDPSVAERALSIEDHDGMTGVVHASFSLNGDCRSTPLNKHPAEAARFALDIFRIRRQNGQRVNALRIGCAPPRV
jgi:hypothetical protein